ncbi:unnamed protein product [Arctogadus glacialis]
MSLSLRRRLNPPPSQQFHAFAHSMRQVFPDCPPSPSLTRSQKVSPVLCGSPPECAWLGVPISLITMFPYYPRHVAVLTETIRKGIHDADSEARYIARRCYWGFHCHYSREAEAFVPGTGIVLSEGSPVPPERLRQHRVPPPVRPLLVLLAGEPESPSLCEECHRRKHDKE